MSESKWARSLWSYFLGNLEERMSQRLRRMFSFHAPEVRAESLKARYEVSEAHSKAILAVGGLCVVSAIVMHVVLIGWFRGIKEYFSSRGKAMVEAPLIAQRQPPPQPRLQSDPNQDLQDYLNRENKLLSTYGWVNQKEGIVRVPVERAMELLLQKRGSSAEAAK